MTRLRLGCGFAVEKSRSPPMWGVTATSCCTTLKIEENGLGRRRVVIGFELRVRPDIDFVSRIGFLDSFRFPSKLNYHSALLGGLCPLSDFFPQFYFCLCF